MRFHKLQQQAAPGWEVLSDEVPFADPFAEVHLLKTRTPMRPERAAWTLVHRKAACVIAPITAEGHFLLIRQERIPVCATLWEFPAGQIDAVEHHEELIRESALRELREETGYELAAGGELVPLGLYFSSPGILDEHGYLFLARPVVPAASGPAPEGGEAISECRAFSPEQLRQMIASGEIRDANTLAVYARMCAMGLWAVS